MRVGLALALTLLTTCPAWADTLPGSVKWLIERSSDPTRIAKNLGPYPVDGEGIVALDPLTLTTSSGTPDITAPQAQVYSVLVEDYGLIPAAMVLVFNDALPVCGQAYGVVGVDTGLTAFTTANHYRKLLDFSDGLEAGEDLFTALEPQLPMEGYANFVKLPNGTRFPVSRSGYGDGGYSLFLLKDDAGAPVAAYLDFVGDRNGEWIDPPPCANV